MELRKRVAEVGLDTKGTKAELIARVEKYLNEQGSNTLYNNYRVMSFWLTEADLLEEEDLGEEEEEQEENGEEMVSLVNYSQYGSVKYYWYRLEKRKVDQ